MTCAFNPQIIINFNNSPEEENETKNYYKNWLRSLLTSFDKLNNEQLQKKSYEYYQHLVKVSTIDRDPIWLSLDRKILEYFHYRGELLFKQTVEPVKKSHKNKYTLNINTKYGAVRHNFSSIRECRETTGLDFRKELRKILY
tara:strand:- start:17 stop:442 length:426 start_codon:yes stop_codon:yes gene_type:complete